MATRKTNAQKYLDLYLAQWDVEQKLDDRLTEEGWLTPWERRDLMKEFKSLGKKMNRLKDKVTDEDFNEHLGDLCCEYSDFLCEVDEEYILD